MTITNLNLDSKYHILVTGGAGFIGSNICKSLIENGNTVTVLDNLATGNRKNIEEIVNKPNFKFIEGDIRDLDTCHEACQGVDYVLHQAALGSVPRSINDPITSNTVNVSGFLNMLVAARDAGAKRFVYAASSSTYGDSKSLPKVEDKIGKPLSPYAITKYVNELYADVFGKTYGMDTVGLRYFNVFGRHQDPNGAYAAVIPKFVLAFMNHKSPIINGDGSYSRDFTYIDNVIEANVRAMTADKTEALNNVYNVAYGERTNLNELVELVKQNLAKFDPKIKNIDVVYGEPRAGDVPHSLASIDKARKLLGYDPKFDMKTGLEECIKWYWENLER